MTPLQLFVVWEVPIDVAIGEIVYTFYLRHDIQQFDIEWEVRGLQRGSGTIVPLLHYKLKSNTKYKMPLRLLYKGNLLPLNGLQVFKLSFCRN